MMCKQFSDAHTSTFAQATAAQYLAARAYARRPGPGAGGVRPAGQAMMQALREELGDAVRVTAAARRPVFGLRLTGANGKLADAAELANAPSSRA